MSQNKAMPTKRLSNIAIITLDNVVLKDNDGRGYCLIYAFLHGIHSRQPEKDRNTRISDAMKLVVENDEKAKDTKLSAASLDTIGKWYINTENLWPKTL